MSSVIQQSKNVCLAGISQNVKRIYLHAAERLRSNNFLNSVKRFTEIAKGHARFNTQSSSKLSGYTTSDVRISNKTILSQWVSQYYFPFFCLNLNSIHCYGFMVVKDDKIFIGKFCRNFYASWLAGWNRLMVNWNKSSQKTYSQEIIKLLVKINFTGIKRKTKVNLSVNVI